MFCESTHSTTLHSDEPSTEFQVIKSQQVNVIQQREPFNADAVTQHAEYRMLRLAEADVWTLLHIPVRLNHTTTLALPHHQVRQKHTTTRALQHRSYKQHANFSSAGPRNTAWGPADRKLTDARNCRRRRTRHRGTEYMENVIMQTGMDTDCNDI